MFTHGQDIWLIKLIQNFQSSYVRDKNFLDKDFQIMLWDDFLFNHRFTKDICPFQYFWDVTMEYGNSVPRPTFPSLQELRKTLIPYLQGHKNDPKMRDRDGLMHLWAVYLELQNLLPEDCTLALFYDEAQSVLEAEAAALSKELGPSTSRTLMPGESVTVFGTGSRRPIAPIYKHVPAYTPQEAEEIVQKYFEGLRSENPFEYLKYNDKTALFSLWREFRKEKKIEHPDDIPFSIFITTGEAFVKTLPRPKYGAPLPEPSKVDKDPIIQFLQLHKMKPNFNPRDLKNHTYVFDLWVEYKDLAKVTAETCPYHCFSAVVAEYSRPLIRAYVSDMDYETHDPKDAGDSHQKIM